MTPNPLIAGSEYVVRHLSAMQQARSVSGFHYHYDYLAGFLSAMRFYQTTKQGSAWVAEAEVEMFEIVRAKQQEFTKPVDTQQQSWDDTTTEQSNTPEEQA